MSYWGSHDEGVVDVEVEDTSQKKYLKVKQLTDVLHALPESYTLSPDLCVFNETCEYIGYIDFLGDGSLMECLSE